MRASNFLRFNGLHEIFTTLLLFYLRILMTREENRLGLRMNSASGVGLGLIRVAILRRGWILLLVESPTFGQTTTGRTIVFKPGTKFPSRPGLLCAESLLFRWGAYDRGMARV
jgi:hypothetical protein